MQYYEDTNTSNDSALRNKGNILVEKATGPDEWKYWHATIDEHLEWLCGTGPDRNPNGHRAWRRNIELARGQHWSDQVASSDEMNSSVELVDDRVTVSHISIHIENLKAYLSKNDPYFNVRPRRPGDEDAAEAQEGLLNYYWREQQFLTELKKCLGDYCAIGHMVARTDWFRELDTSQRPKNAKDPDATLNYNSYERAEHPGFRRVNPFTFLVDRNTPTFDLKGARWCGEIFARPKADVIEDERYDKTLRRKIRAGAETPRTLQQHLQNYKDQDSFWGSGGDDYDDDQMMVLVEIWDKRFRVRRVFALGVEKPLVEESWPYDYLDNFPYEMANFISIPNEIYGIGHVHLTAQAQLLIDRLRTKMALHARKHNSKYQISGKISDSEYSKLLSDEDGSYIKTEPGTEIRAVDQAKLSFDVLQAAEILERDMQLLMNTDALQRGGALPSRTSAQEIDARQQIYGTKLSDHAATIDLFLLNIGRQLLQHIKRNLTTEVAIQIAGRSGRKFVTATAEDVKRDLDVEIESTTREVVTPAVEREQRMTLLSTLSQLLPQIMQIQQLQMQQGAPPAEPISINFKELLKQVLGTFDGVEVDRIFPAAGEAPIPVDPGYTDGGGVQGAVPAPSPNVPNGVDLAQGARQQATPTPQSPFAGA